MRGHRLLLLILLASLAYAQTPDLAALEQRFQTDPLGAIDETERLFSAAEKDDDVDGMAAVARVAVPRLVGLPLPPVANALATALMAKAQAAGRWTLLGDAFMMRAEAAEPYSAGAVPSPLLYERQRLASDAALLAYGRAGPIPSSVTDRIQYWRRAREEGLKLPFHSLDRHRQLLGDLSGRCLALQQLVADAHDGEAIEVARRLVDAAAEHSDVVVRDMVAEQVCSALVLPGSVPLLSSLQERLLPRCGPYAWYVVAHASARSWSGRGDAFLALYTQCRVRLEQDWRFADLVMPRKARALGQRSFAMEVVRRDAASAKRRHGNLAGSDFRFAGEHLFAETPDALRHDVVALCCRSAHLSSNRADADFSIAPFARVPSMAPAHLRAQWSLETGQELAACAPRIRYPEVRVKAFETAAKLLEDGGRKDLAEQARATAVVLSQGHPIALLACSVLAAQRAADSGDWKAVDELLTVGLTGAPPGEWWLQGSLLLAQAYRQQDKADLAETLVQTIATSLPTLTTNAATKVNALLDLSRLTRDPPRKLAYLEVARRNADEAQLDFVREQVARELAEASVAQGQTNLAINALLDVVEAQERKRDRLAFDPLLRRKWFAGNLAVYRRLLDLCAQTHDAKLALWTGERMRARALMDQLAWRKLDFTVNLPPSLRQRAERLRAKREEVGQLLRRLGSPVGEKESPGEPSRAIPLRGETPLTSADLAKLRALVAEVGEEEASLEAVIREQVPAYREASRVENADPNTLVRRLPAKTAVLELTVTDQAVVGLAIGPQRQMVVRQLDIKAAELAKEVTDAREAVVGRGRQWQEALSKWHQRLIAPFAETIGEAQKLLVIADGPLQLLPFAALRDAGGRFLVESHAIATAPSLGVALSPSQRTPRPTQAGLIVAAPSLEPTPQETLLADLPPLPKVHSSQRDARGLSASLLELARVALPGAAAEGRAVSQRLPGSRLLTGREATKAKLLQQVTGQPVLHIATHGYADPEAPDLSGLLLAGEQPGTADVLTAHEVYLLRLDAKLVCLSACETGLGQDLSGEGLLGLTRSFLYAGAQEVVCSLWQVPDAATARLMERFYETWRGDAASALREAQLALLQAPETRRPYHWAAFQVVNGPR